jgi:hypothetical protein
MKLLLAIGLGVLGSGAAFAQTSDMNTDLYTCGETSVDIAGMFATRDKDGIKHDTWGMAAGLNYFFIKYVGVGAETYFDAWEVPYLVNGDAYLRYPIMHTGLAPYGFGGGGREWTHAPQWMGHVGVGIEYRFHPGFGAFFDAREVFPDHTKDYAVLRFGFRLSFH